MDSSSRWLLPVARSEKGGAEGMGLPIGVALLLCVKFASVTVRNVFRDIPRQLAEDHMPTLYDIRIVRPATTFVSVSCK
jgi:hypothetical protein